MLLGERNVWHKLSTCLWRSPFGLSNMQDLSTIYADLEDFFVRRLHLKKASPSMLIKEVKRMAEEAQPRVDEIRTRLVNIGMMLTKVTVDEAITQALASLKEVKFLPMRQTSGPSILAGINDDYAIPDHERYYNAFAGHGVLLDFELDDMQTMNSVFMRLGLSHRYLSQLIKEVSTIGDDVQGDEGLTLQLQMKAYALYW
jgi:hypothetical protein